MAKKSQLKIAKITLESLYLILVEAKVQELGECALT
jgi:hypothetical protein